MQALQLVGIHKSYGEVDAVRGVSLSFETGHVHAVAGENGAGKSTLLKVAAGVVDADAGQVHVEGRLLAPPTAAEAIRRGVGMVQQESALVSAFTVLENIVLGAEPSRWGRLDLAGARQRASQVLGELDAPIPLDAGVASLGAGDRLRLEVARVLFRNARVLIFDEPTAVLTARESEGLYALLRRLATSGRAVIVVTHDLDQVIAHADAVSVLRRGTLVSSRALPPRGKRHDDAAELAADVMGDGALDAPARAQAAFGGPSLVVKNVRFGRALDDTSFEVRSGEIVGLAAAPGSGQDELVRVIAGIDRPDSGMVWIKGDGGDGARGVPAIVYGDRRREGLVLDADVRDNLVLGELARFSVAGVLRPSKVDAEARHRAERGMVQPPDLARPVRALSGGNQQKVAVARALATIEAGAHVLVVAHPTRGVDVGATRVIHEQLLDVAFRRRCAVLVISADLQELRRLSDRILVLSHGRIVAELSKVASNAEIGDHMRFRGASA